MQKLESVEWGELLTDLSPALIAFIGIIIVAKVNWNMNKSQFNGLVISQSRINWIQDVRKNAAKYLNHMTEIKIFREEISNIEHKIKQCDDELIYETIINTDEFGEPFEVDIPHQRFEGHNDIYWSEIKTLDNKKSDFLHKLNVELDKVKETNQLLRLYLPKQNKEGEINEDHKKLQDIMDRIQSIADKTYEDNRKLELDEFNDKLDELTNEVSAYLKQEWDKAKENK